MNQALGREGGFSLVGTSPPRVDALEKVTGSLRFSADMPMEGVLHGALVRSPHPHALIKGIDAGEARRVRGYLDLVTARDVPGLNRWGIFRTDQPVFCEEKVLFVGDVVALVVAVTREAAKEAASRVRVNYELLPAVLDPEEALEPDSPLVHDSGNLISHCRVRRGDVEKGFREADVIVEDIYHVPFVEHAYLEPDCIVVTPNPNGTITARGAMQAPFTVRKNLARVLALPLSEVQVVAVSMGGGFGGKEDSSIDVAVRAAVAARKLRRTVKVELDREEINLATSKRHPMKFRCRMGATQYGKLTAIEGTFWDEQGAYASLGPHVPPAGGVHLQATVMMAGPYVVPNVKVDGYLVYTNKTYSGAMRGFGVPQVTFLHESMMDELARRLGMDPLEVRLRNVLRAGDETSFGQRLQDSVGLEETMLSASGATGWKSRWASPPEVLEGGRRLYRGLGMALGWFGVGLGVGLDAGGANVHVGDDGSVLVGVASVEMGQGLKTVMTQMAAEVFGVELCRVRLTEADTDTVPESGPTVASRSTTVVGNAVVGAALEVRRTMAEVAGEELEAHPDDLLFRGGRVFVGGHPERSLRFEELALKCYLSGKRLVGQSWWAPPSSSLDPDTGQGNPYHVYIFGTQVAEVEVDVETGETKVLSIAAAYDVGRAINPLQVQCQIEGGVSMGLGYGVMEDFLVDEGIPLTPDLSRYLIPTSLDMPSVKPIIVEAENALGPYGAKGIGEPPCIPTAPAITNAIFNAVGARVYGLPASPERVLSAIRSRRTRA